MAIKTFNLDEKYPQVVLVGNGLVRKNGIEWVKLIDSCKRNDVDISKYKDNNGFAIPNNILTLATLNNDDSERHELYSKQLEKISYSQNDHIDSLVSLPFDAILTTNYTYELEYAINNYYPHICDISKRKYMQYANTGQKQEKYLIHTYNKLSNDTPDIWHIHGEARRKSSLILSHEEYARLINKILEYNSSRRNSYEKFRHELKIKSWIDYFILADLYIIGFSFDFSEFDLWWLLNRRLREKTKIGSVYFYEPIENKNKYKMKVLDEIGVKVLDLGIDVSNITDRNAKNSLYTEFYSKAIQDIASKINNK